MSPNRVFVIEDSEPDRAAIRDVLVEYCTPDNIVFFESGRAFETHLAAAKSDISRPSVILVDLNLPDCNGTDLIRTIRRDPHIGSVPVVVLTAIIVPDTITACYEAGANSYCVKEVDMHVYRENLQSLCYNWLRLAISPNDDM